MPSLNWIGKESVVNHDKEVPFKLLKKVPSSSVGKESKNLIIHGDNLEALKALLPFYKGRVKCIYIDPPYNTGNENWIYNDKVNSPKIKQWLGKVVGRESEDLTRHDKWLCMMYPRLKLLKDLLSDDGAIFISIDDNEHCNLRLVMDEIFLERNFVESFIWKSRLGKGATSQTTAKLHEYVISYAKDLNKLRFKTDKRISTKDTKERLRQWGQGDRREDRPTMYYPIHSKIFGKVFPKRADGSDGRWRIGENRMKELISSGLVVFEKQKDGRIEAYKIILSGNETNTAYSSLLDSEVVKTTAHGSIELKGIFGKDLFSYPKPTSLVGEIISLCADKEDIVLDSFAGSGTTGHAVMGLNKEDGGNRKFIMIEMEDSVAKDITAERVRRAIKKYGYKDGFEYCELARPLFNEKGQINAQCSYAELATYVYFTETKKNTVMKNIKPPYIGESGDISYYLIYTSKDKNDLTRAAFTKLKIAKPAVVYADRCLVDEDELREKGIIFKQIPYEIKIY